MFRTLKNKVNVDFDTTLDNTCKTVTLSICAKQFRNHYQTHVKLNGINPEKYVSSDKNVYSVVVYAKCVHFKSGSFH